MNISVRLLFLVAFGLVPLLGIHAQSLSKSELKQLHKQFGDEFNIEQQGASFILSKKEYLIQKDYDVFVKYVRDSIGLEMSFLNRDDDFKAKEYLKVPKNNTINISQRDSLRSAYYLNYSILKKHLNRWDAQDYLVFSCFLHQHKAKRFFVNFFNDNRGLRYEQDSSRFGSYEKRNSTSETSVLILQTPWQFATLSKQPSDLLNVYSKTAPFCSKYEHVLGLSDEGFQGFLHWKQRDVDKKLQKLNQSFSVVPIIDTVYFSIEIEGKELQKRWKITEEEYNSFLQYTLDSLKREFLYLHILDGRVAGKFINYSKEYFDWDALEYMAYDASDSIFNRTYFPLNFKTKINYKDYEVDSLMKVFFAQLGCDSLPYRYSYIDARKQVVDSTTKNQMKYYDNLKTSFYVIETDSLNIKPKIDESIPFIANLSYRQALAFYHWKYPIKHITENSDWRQYVFPDEEDFELYQASLTGVIEYFEYSDEIIEIKLPVFKYDIILR